jgi:hypothetical protein
MFETQNVQTVANGLTLGEARQGAMAPLTTLDDMPVEIYRQEVPENGALIGSLTVQFVTADFTGSGSASTEAALIRPAGLGPSFQTGGPNLTLNDPDLVGVTLNQIIQGNDYVVQLVGVAATNIRWSGPTSIHGITTGVA